MLQVIKKAKEISDADKTNYVCIDYSGHVQLLSITIRKRQTNDEICRFETYLDNPQLIGSLEEIVQAFYEKIKELSITDQSHDSSND